MNSDDTFPPGWYPDPDGKPCDRFWDGKSWVDDTRPQRLMREESSFDDDGEDESLPVSTGEARGTGGRITPGIFFGLFIVGVLAVFVVWFSVAGQITGMDRSESSSSIGETDLVSGSTEDSRLEVETVWAQLELSQQENVCLAFISGAPVTARAFADYYYGTLQQPAREAVAVQVYDFLEEICGAPTSVAEITRSQDCQWLYVLDSISFADRPSMKCTYDSSTRRYVIELCLPLRPAEINITRSGSGLSIASAAPRSLGIDLGCLAANEAAPELWEFSIARRTAELGNIKVMSGKRTLIELVPDVADQP